MTRRQLVLGGAAAAAVGVAGLAVAGAAAGIGRAVGRRQVRGCTGLPVARHDVGIVNHDDHDDPNQRIDHPDDAAPTAPAVAIGRPTRSRSEGRPTSPTPPRARRRS